MKTVQWQMKEDFAFPASTGTPTGAESIHVTPRYTVDRKDESVKLTGIYHLAVNVQFDVEASQEHESDSAILMDDVDFNGNLGYFEYAVPFNIDLPPEANDPYNLVTANPICELDGQGAIGIIWDVQCTYKEVIVVPESNQEPIVHLEVEDEAVVEQAVVEHLVKYQNVSLADDEDETLSFIAGLEDGISTTLFRSNDVSV